MVLLNFFWIVKYIQFHLLAWFELTLSRVNIENLVVKDVLFECFLWSWFSWISPWFHLNFRIVREFELPISPHSTNILQSQSYFPWF
jgi:hypothetical protein